MTEVKICPICGSKINECICTVDLRESRNDLRYGLHLPTKTRASFLSSIISQLDERTVQILDVSAWDVDPVDYGNYNGIIPRCYTGTSKDARFDIHRDGAIAAGKPWWAYSFYNFLKPALPQAKAVAEILAANPGNIPPYWDVEQWKYWDGEKWVWVLFPSRDVLLAGMFTLYNEYKNLTGLYTGFYLNPATLHYLKPLPPWLRGCSGWIAHWGVDNPDYEPLENYTFHQFRGEPDISKYNGSDSQYWAFVKGTQSPPPIPPTPQPLPDFVYPNGIFGYLNLRSEPDSSNTTTIVGTAKNNKKWKPIDKVIGSDGREYWKINDYVFMAKWLTRW